MRGVSLLGNCKVDIKEFPNPKPNDRQVVIKMGASGLCGSDLPPYRTSPEDLGDRKLIIVGHEPCGTVVEVGSYVRNIRIGDRVIVHHYSGCGECEFCETGWTQLCQVDMVHFGGKANGAHADYQLVYDYMCVPMPDKLSFEEGASIACGTGTAYQALKRLDVSGRDILAVFGQGPVGVSATLLGTFMGARVISIDPVRERRELAEANGAWKTIDPALCNPTDAINVLTKGRGADASIDASGIDQVRAQAIRSTRIWGRCCLVGEGGSLTLKPSPDIIHKQLNLMGSWTFSTVVLKELADWIVAREIPLSKIITNRLPLEKAGEAFNLLNSSKTGKIVITYP